MGWARFALTGLALLWLAIERPDGLAHALFIEMALAAYLGLSAVLVALEMRGTKISPPAYFIVHGADIFLVSTLVYASESATSPFFVFFIFINIAAAIHWGWRGAAVTSVLLVVIFLGLVALQPETEGLSSEGARTLVRSGFLVLSGALLAYLGAHRERRAVQFSRLAEWPPFSLRNPVDAAPALAHAAAVVGANRLLIIWAERDEPCHHVLLWTPEDIEITRELLPADVARPLESFSETETVSGDLMGYLIERFGASSALSASFSGPHLYGGVFMLDRACWSDEHVALVKIIAARIGLELEEDVLQSRLEQLAEERERNKLARDLHDGVLQALTAASLHLKVAAERQPQQTSNIYAIQDLLTREARRLRRFIDESRDTTAAASADSSHLARMLRRRAEGAERQWGCTITCDLDASIHCSPRIARHMRHMLSEAVANAVRHGDARNINVRLFRHTGLIVLEIADDGSGFPGLSGRYSAEDLETMNAGPRSLLARAREIPGSLWLETSACGVKVSCEAFDEEL